MIHCYICRKRYRLCWAVSVKTIQKMWKKIVAISGHLIQLVLVLDFVCSLLISLLFIPVFLQSICIWIAIDIQCGLCAQFSCFLSNHMSFLFLWLCYFFLLRFIKRDNEISHFRGFQYIFRWCLLAFTNSSSDR